MPQTPASVPPNGTTFPIDPSIRDLTFDGVFTVDREGCFVDANLGARTILGYDMSDLRGRDVREIIRHGGPEGERRPFESLVKRGSFFWSGWLTRKDASPIAAEARVARTADDLYTIVFREKGSAAKAEAVEEFHDDQLLQLSRLRKNILESLNHEFRTPLTAILGYSQIIKDIVEPEYEPIIDDIERSGNRLLEAFMTLIELAKIRTGDFPMYPRIHDVVEIVTTCVERAEWLADEKGITVAVIAEDRPAIAHVDEYALKRIVYSLVDNAVKFTETGTVEVTVRYTRDTFEIDVHDTGVGISPEFMPMLYDAFTQESTGLNRIYQGAGMGLALSAMLVEAMEGRILVQSTKGEGSTFTVILPRNVPQLN